MKPFLHTQKTKIISQGKPVILKGVNLGGWLMMEGYILHGPNIAGQLFKTDFADRLSDEALEEFEDAFRDSFITEKDLKRVASWGFNCIRVPFNYRLLGESPYRKNPVNIRYLDQVIRWAEKYHLWVILDLHAAPGSQNCDWHSDSVAGQAELWTDPENQEKTLELWDFLGLRYKNKEIIAGYDLLNESVIEQPQRLNAFYKRLIKTIRRVDRNHILFVEGNKWAVDISCLEAFDDDNLALSIHFYQPLDFTFNLVPHQTYPFRFRFNKSVLDKMLQRYAKIAAKRSVPIFVGEFGVNYREGLYGEDIWIKNVLDCFKRYGFHWTYWTYKAIKNSVFPDGILSYYENPGWVNRQGPGYGWENYHQHWQGEKKEVIRSWKSEQFKENTKILKVLRGFVTSR